MERKPMLGFWQIWNLSFGFFGIQIGFALQGANVSRIFQTLGAPIDSLPILWIAGPVTGLIVQPLIGHFSDRTWGPLGRRRPYFLAGAILTSLSLLILPNAPYLWLAAGAFWILDASLNIATEPFRAFVGDMLPTEQRTRGYAMQGVFIGAGALLASAAPFILTNGFGVANTAPEGIIPDSVKLSFYIGAVALTAAILWTILTTKEYPPEQLAAFKEPPSLFREELRPGAGAAYYLRAGAALLGLGLLASAAIWHWRAEAQLYVLSAGLAVLGAGFLLNAWLEHAQRADQFFSHILSDLTAMPKVMRRLALVQFFSWFGLFVMWIYATPAITAHHFGAANPTDAHYGDGADWVGIMFATYNGIAAVYSFFSPVLVGRFGKRPVHAFNLACGGAGLASFYFIRDPNWLLFSMVGVGIAWSSILTLPYAMLADALPPQKMGVFMGIFNFFIVIPQIIASGVLGAILTHLLGGDAIRTLLLGGASMFIAAVATFWIPRQEMAHKT